MKRQCYKVGLQGRKPGRDVAASKAVVKWPLIPALTVVLCVLLAKFCDLPGLDVFTWKVFRIPKPNTAPPQGYLYRLNQLVRKVL